MKNKQIVVRRSEIARRISSNNIIPSSTATQNVIRYGECQKNHAAKIGGHAVDGCREFMASGEEGRSCALMCAACGCHRNFHRKRVEEAHQLVSDSSSSPSSSS
ncbi:hypothetical protein Dimus_004901 [Dionaea muscipula]